MAFRQQDIETENFTPRPYQLELLEKAKKSNLIIPLGTGTGKTFIAVMLIRECAADTRVPFEQGGKRSFFLVDKVALVKQQADEMRVHTDLNVSEYHGGKNTDMWGSDKWEKEFKENNVLVMTAQIFLDLVNHGFLHMERANVIVFDECHHATKGHAYREIMRHYNECKDSRPRILGLTASIIKEDTTPSKLSRMMHELECALHCRIETSSDITSASKYGAKPRLVTLNCRNFDDVKKKFSNVRQLLQRTLDFCKDADFNKQLEVDPRDPIYKALKRTLAVFDQLGPWCAWRVCTIIERQLVRLDKYSMEEVEQLFILMGQTTIRMAKQMMEPYVSDVDSLEKALQWLPDRVKRLLEILRSMNPRKRENTVKSKDGVMTTTKGGKKGDDHDFSGIIFVEQRYVAKTLRDCLKRLQNYAKEDFGYLKIDFVVGFSGYNVAEEDERSLHKRQEEVLKNFRQKHLNLLVATSVLEEGLDIRQCNCVIRYDSPKDFKSFVQSRGRARKKGSIYVVLIEEQNADAWAATYKNYVAIEEILLSHCQSRQAPPKIDIDMHQADQILPPYYAPVNENEPMEGRPRVTMTTAIPLVNRYCAKLPSDVFTRLAPHYDVKTVKQNGVDYFQGSLVLPINSPVKEEILGPLMPTQKYAQMATALEACKILHQRQELDRHLLPVGKESAAKFLIDEDEEWSPGDRILRPGSTKRKQYYIKKVADPFVNARPAVSSPTYVHIIDLELAKPVVSQAITKRNRLSFDPSGYQRLWGILSKKSLPMIPGFPLYARQGLLTVRISSLPFTIQLEEDELTLISSFHEYLFSDILRLEKYSMRYDANTAKNAVYVVPLKKVDADGFVVDFPFVKNIVETVYDLPRIPTEEEREQFEFVPERYMDAVIMPWYRNPDQPFFFYVTEICYHLNPSSHFPDAEYASFNDYFMHKYGLYINNQAQPMLEGDYTASRLNLTLPRYGRRGQSLQPAVVKENSAKTETASLGQKQLYPPELVDIHPIPASLWSMIVCLPTILYRVNSLLVADEWRRRVEQDAFGRDGQFPATFSWEPLSYGWRQKGGPSEVEPEEDESTVNNSTQRDGPSGNTTNNGERGFEIGVWDPNLAQNIAADTPSVQPRNGLIADQSVPTAVNGQDTPNADDDDWDDDEIYFSTEISERFRTLEHRARSGGVNGESKFDDPFAPRTSIVPTGWDAAPDTLAVDTGDAGGIALSFLSADGQFNADALLNDIVKTEFGAASSNVASNAVVSQQQPITQPQPAARASGFVGETEEAWGGKAAGKKSKRKQRNINAVDFEDLDDRPVEETIDLIDLGIEENGHSVSPPPTKSKRISPMLIVDVDAPIELVIKAANGAERICVSERDSPHLLDMDDNDFSDLKQAASLTDDVYARIAPLIPLPVEGALISFETDNFDAIPYGPSPCLILQALTMSNANDGFNLERLETVGDSFLKYAVTSCLFNSYSDFHEGKLSFLRSKHVSNYNLYKLGKRKGLGEIMVASKFEPSDNWLPPGYIPVEKDTENVGVEEADKKMERILEAPLEAPLSEAEKLEVDFSQPEPTWPIPDELAGVIPYNLLTQHSIPDKSIADAVEAMIGVYLLTYGPRRAVEFLKWLGLKPAAEANAWEKPPRDPLLKFLKDPDAQLRLLWQRFNFSAFENEIGYVFKHKAYLVQSFTHASYYYNRVTDCYQRLEFLGDAVLDYMITRHLFEDKRLHSPGVLTDLRSALVNNTIFASLAVKYKFHKYFMALCPGMSKLMKKFVDMIEERQQESNFDEELYLLNEEDVEDEEDIEVPKSLGDMFEAVAGAIYLDSGGSLDAVWRVYYRMMKEQIEKCCANPPKSPIRELLEMEPERAKFAKLERDVVEGKVRVTVDVFGKGRFVGMGRNYRIAKCTAAKRALKYLKTLKAREAQEAAAGGITD